MATVSPFTGEPSTASDQLEPPAPAPAQRQTMHGIDARNNVAGETALWVLLIADLFQFTLFFALFSYHRGRDPMLFDNTAGNLHVELGFTNTLVLILGSVLVAAALRRWGNGAPDHAVTRLIRCASGCGVVFVAIKITEYILNTADGHTIGENSFFMFYYCVTGFHFVHAIAGTVALLFAARAISLNRAQPSIDRRGAVYSVGLLWHLVDVIWLVLFSLFYIS
jgi:nitric oxide reductase NorE protein